MKVLMFGWEFPPISSGGLGTACYGLTKGLANNNIPVTFVLPKGADSDAESHVKLIVADGISSDKIKFKGIDSVLMPYISSDDYDEAVRIMLQRKGSRDGMIYGRNLFSEVHRFSEKAKLIAEAEDFDIIHAHDWMTFQAGIKAKEASNKPLVVHVHATEFDRTGGNSNQYVYDIEREGMHAADTIIAVSNYTKTKIVEHYGIDPSKVHVVHNAVDIGHAQDDKKLKEKFKLMEHEKVVLFLGRITLQKGPDYFLDAAKKVLEMDRDVKFIVAGSGDMEPRMIEKAAHLGIADKVLFAGFLSGPDIDKAYQMADLYVMPSVSEPFGITPLEAMKNNTPVIISKQSGVSEVINNCLRVDFWDIDEMANKILAVLKYSTLHASLRENGSREIKKFNWNVPAKKCIDVYNNTLTRHEGSYEGKKVDAW